MIKEDYYRAIAEIHLMEFEDFHLQLDKCLIAKGILLKMKSDLNLFLKDNPPTEKTDERLIEINELIKSVEYFDKIAAVHVQMKEVNKINNKWMESIKNENKMLREENIKLVGTLTGNQFNNGSIR